MCLLHLHLLLWIVLLYTGEFLAECPECDEGQIQTAIQAAASAFPRWSKSSGAYRAEFLESFARVVEENKALLAEKEAVNVGKPLPEAEWDVDDVVHCFRYYARQARKLDVGMPLASRGLLVPGERVFHLGVEEKEGEDEDDESDFVGLVRQEPVGVVSAIIPWNYPLLMFAWKVAPALAAGCTVVIKPSELTPFTALDMGFVCQQIGLPAGVLNVVSGRGSVVGSGLVQHPLVRKVSFTGSVPTGKVLQRAVVPALANITLELGGKSAALVFPSACATPALLRKTVEWILFGVFWTNGQICSATSRLLVHESVYEAVLGEMRRMAEEKIVLGAPLDPLTKLGPVVSAGQLGKIREYVRRGVEEAGATLWMDGSNCPKAPSFSPSGFFQPPTIFRDVSPDHVLWREEIFGPVLAVRPFQTEEEAVALANDTIYGLAGAVFSEDEQQQARVSQDLDCGIVWVNCSQPCFAELPWGGRKQSGIGRDLGIYGLQSFMEPKQVVKAKRSEPLGWYETAKL